MAWALRPRTRRKAAGPHRRDDDAPAPVDWLGRALDCRRCDVGVRQADARCALSHACVHDRYARRVERFFQWNPQAADDWLEHPYFEVRATAARHASLFRLRSVFDDLDETVRTVVAERVPRRLLGRFVHDPHREVRIRVAQRLEPQALAVLRSDRDYGVRAWVARRATQGILLEMTRDPDPLVRAEVARRLNVAALHVLATDPDMDVRRVVASRARPSVLGLLARDARWEVRWEVANRASRAVAEGLAEDPEEEVRIAATGRLAELKSGEAGEPGD